METLEQTAVIGGIGFERLDEGMKYITKWTPTRIPSGGCGVFALLLYDHLAALGVEQVITARIGQQPYRVDIEDNLIGYVNGKNGVDETGAKHVCIYAKIDGNWVYVDNDGINDHQLLSTIRRSDGVELTREQLVDIIDHSKAWNPVFDRSVVPVIADRMRDVFAGVTLHFPEIPVLYTEYTIDQQRKRMAFYW